MKLLIGSDYHLNVRLQAQALKALPEMDGYINTGDYCQIAGLSSQAYGGCNPAALMELKRLIAFMACLESTNKPWLYCPGNHDPTEGYPELTNILRSIQVFEWMGLQILSVPFTPPCGWSWNLTENHIEYLLCASSSGAFPAIDILITHAPPYKVLDEDGQWYKEVPTLLPVLEAIKPRYYLCGHMHLDGGKSSIYGDTLVVNAACHNMVIEIDPNNRKSPLEMQQQVRVLDPKSHDL